MTIQPRPDWIKVPTETIGGSVVAVPAPFCTECEYVLISKWQDGAFWILPSSHLRRCSAYRADDDEEMGIL